MFCLGPCGETSGPSGSLARMGNCAFAEWPKSPRPSSTLPFLVLRLDTPSLWNKTRLSSYIAEMLAQTLFTRRASIQSRSSLPSLEHYCERRPSDPSKASGTGSRSSSIPSPPMNALILSATPGTPLRPRSLRQIRQLTAAAAPFNQGQQPNGRQYGQIAPQVHQAPALPR